MKSGGEPLLVALDLLPKGDGRYAVKFGQVAVEHDFRLAHIQNSAFHDFDGYWEQGGWRRSLLFHSLERLMVAPRPVAPHCGGDADQR